MGDYAEHGYDKAEGTVVKTSTKAILFRESEKFGGEEYWVPRSHIHDDSEVWKQGDEGMLVVTEWLAIKKGWIGMNEKKDLKDLPVKGPDATSSTEALVDAMKPTELSQSKQEGEQCQEDSTLIGALTTACASGKNPKGDK